MKARGPIRIEVIEPLQKLKLVIEPSNGFAAEIVFEGRSFPIEEPRFMRRIGPRAFMDYTRLTQNARCSGWIEVDGVRKELAAGTVGTRDRSWGVRPVGAQEVRGGLALHGVIVGVAASSRQQPEVLAAALILVL